MYARLAGFYFFYFATIGILVPYWSPYLQQLGYRPEQIGILLASSLLPKLIAPYLWGWLADHSGRRALVVQITCIAALLNLGLVYYSRNHFVGLFMALLLFNFFWHATLPQFEAITLNQLGRHSHRYGHIRLWGSVGFILSTMIMGLVLQQSGIHPLPLVLFGLFVLLSGNSLLLAEPQHQNSARQPLAITTVLRRPEITAFFVVCLLMQASHGPYYTFFTIQLKQLNYTGSVIGALWSVGVIAEIVVFLLLPRLLVRFSDKQLLSFTIQLTILRWLINAYFAEQLALLLVAQCLHGFSFGLFYALAMRIIQRFFPDQLQGRGQALLSSIGFGVGGALGNLAAGYLWASGGASSSYLSAALLAACAWLVAWRSLS